MFPNPRKFQDNNFIVFEYPFEKGITFDHKLWANILEFIFLAFPYFDMKQNTLSVFDN